VTDFGTPERLGAAEISSFAQQRWRLAEVSNLLSFAS
jgi:hypothetical protein